MTDDRITTIDHSGAGKRVDSGIREHMEKYHHPFTDKDNLLWHNDLVDLHERDHNTRAGLRQAHTHPEFVEEPTYGPVVRHPVSNNQLETILRSELSQWYWIVMPNGDRMVGFYPQAGSRGGYESFDSVKDNDGRVINLND